MSKRRSNVTDIQRLLTQSAARKGARKFPGQARRAGKLARMGVTTGRALAGTNVIDLTRYFRRRSG